MNLVFISPNFPTYYWNFCKSLRERGVTVLGIGDAPYDDLVSETRESLVEYYRVNNLQNYDEVYRAMGFFIKSLKMMKNFMNFVRKLVFQLSLNLIME